MEYHVLASGSKGNSIFIYDKDEGLLIDCGISRKQLLYKLDSLGFKERDIRHVLLTHDHYDHNKNIGIFDQKIVYSGKNCIPHLDETHVLKPYQDIDLDHFRITPLPLSHDATSPLGFVIKGYQETILYMTDTGYVSQKNMKYIDNLDYYIFESNHDVEMLMATKRPLFLKNRIYGDEGHLNNEYSANIMAQVIGNKTKEICLAHLSQEANTKEKALETYHQVFNQRGINFKNIKVTSQVDIVSGGHHED
ncbi:MULTISPECIES: MBL fold metallo-hydrolase [Coprobacillaceae]|uniref:MBL fold metallo-hydrolase n=1 Tax=Coprobacillaceae TaxID=2810280 RepID=UPI000E48D24B|nr:MULTISPECIES: MBL fold metallo-hydrolase [Coprobacillaceae]RHM59943.1 MBL fold metallo-hydrolase [Coprobacillus sp. AF33-1AC]RHS92280.1 MBL fold metallo-hydrolase [Erysipelatoclostridium sp. AM42-17]